MAHNANLVQQYAHTTLQHVHWPIDRSYCVILDSFEPLGFGSLLRITISATLDVNQLRLEGLKHAVIGQVSCDAMLTW